MPSRRRTLAVATALAAALTGAAAVTASSVSTAAATPAAATAPEATLNIALEIHVENSADPAAELRTIAQMIAAANRSDIDITFSLDEAMLRHLSTASTAVKRQLTRWEGAGHQFGLHADVARLDATAASTWLATMVEDYTDAFGHAPSSVSGACSATGDWVDAALDNGLGVIAGTVVYCERTLDEAHYASTAYAAEVGRAIDLCATPLSRGCHDQAPASDDTRRVDPWRTDDAFTWLDDTGAAGLVAIVPTLGDTSLECASEGVSGSCSFDAPGDAAAFVALVEQAELLSAEHPGATLHLAWSTNNRPSNAYIKAVLAAMAKGVAASTTAGPVDWVTLGQAGAGA